MSNSKRFLISDLHLYHTRLLEPRGFDSIEEMNEFIVSQWNSVVRTKDTVWVLGDVILDSKNIFEDAKILDRLRGDKKLILGNHDCSANKMLVWDKHFSSVMSYKQFGKTNKILLSHIPVAEQQFHRFALNIHGHLHTQEIDDTRYMNVSCELLNYIPVEWKEVVRRL